MHFHNPNILALGILVCPGYGDGQFRLCVNLTMPKLWHSKAFGFSIQKYRLVNDKSACHRKDLFQ
jgi:hypothetical protein